MTATVAEAADPDAALTMAQKLGQRIELLISDINLSASIDGVELARELAMANPSMKVLLMSAQSLLDCVIALCDPSRR
jgi:DNA-binding NarL/FixJ family response regulator